ncbi:hypothetical protein U14_01453 [Candidatus Moduliflexus flocculans]|uniref:Uncharacterized protein n=1 Tax=Candidatus Moduliflexus flocculans TaxID=1499966 RepID=A0A0S6VSC2_9BACT|nr:hypothetical protein U14_01453 [Candidatus Moduliflexus flocculans]
MKPFSQWTKEEVEEEFRLTSAPQHPLLQQWLSAPAQLSENEQKTLRQLSRKLLAHVHDWNEEELKIYFIAFLLDFVDFYQERYRPFLERELSVEYAEGKRLWGMVDFLVASGKQTPKEPFFFLHEYKKQADTSNDPVGQLLAEMVAAHTANRRKHPVYDAYVIGRPWYFVLLDGQTYAESLAYDATKEEIFAIAAILRQTKTMIDSLL